MARGRKPLVELGVEAELDQETLDLIESLEAQRQSLIEREKSQDQIDLIQMRIDSLKPQAVAEE